MGSRCKMQKKKKEKWERPKMIVLFRGKPEEAVLTGCKSVLEEAIPTGYYEACRTGEFCPWCNANIAT